MTATFISAVAQVMLKKAALNRCLTGARQYLNPLVITAYGFFLGATLLTVWSLRVLPLGVVAVLDSASYLYATFFGMALFGEQMNKQKMAALLLILAGIFVFNIC